MDEEYRTAADEVKHENTFRIYATNIILCHTAGRFLEILKLVYKSFFHFKL